MSEEEVVAIPAEVPESPKRKLLLIGGVVLFVIVVALGIILSPLGKKLMGGSNAAEANKQEEKVEDIKEVSYIPVPEVLVNLRSNSSRRNFLKITIVLEAVGTHSKDVFDNYKPRIIDQMQTFLRQLDLEDLRGSAGLENLRQELLVRINRITSPTKVKNVLFKELLVQ